MARSNALKALDADRFPQIRFQASDIDKTDDGYRLTGTLEIHGVAVERGIDLHVDDLGDTWRLSCVADVRQSEFGIKPYSMLMGSMKVVDTVTVSFTAKQVQGRLSCPTAGRPLMTVEHVVDHGMVELGRFIHEGLMTRLVEPDQLLRRCAEHVE